MSLANEIQLFMVESSDLYATDADQVYLAWCIRKCIDHNQIMYSPGEYASFWWMIKPGDVASVANKIIPDDITSGSVLYVAECVCKDKRFMREIVRRYRELSFDGVFWHRDNKPLSFPRQKGAAL